MKAVDATLSGAAVPWIIVGESNDGGSGECTLLKPWISGLPSSRQKLSVSSK
jgi:hypothetical protein